MYCGVTLSCVPTLLGVGFTWKIFKWFRVCTCCRPCYGIRIKVLELCWCVVNWSREFLQLEIEVFRVCRFRGLQRGRDYVCFVPTSTFMSRWLMTLRCTHLLRYQRCRSPSLRNSTTVLVLPSWVSKWTLIRCMYCHHPCIENNRIWKRNEREKNVGHRERSASSPVDFFLQSMCILRH